MVWVVDADEETRINRIMIRDKLTREQAIDRINNQMSQSEKVKKADYVIDNSGDKYTLYNQINNILNLIEESEQ